MFLFAYSLPNILPTLDMTGVQKYKGMSEFKSYYIRQIVGLLIESSAR